MLRRFDGYHAPIFKKRVVVIHKDDYLRKTLELVINGSERFLTLGSYNNFKDAIETLKKINDNLVVIIDIDLPDVNGVDAICYLIRKIPHLKILVYTDSVEEEVIFASLRAGAFGYLKRSSNYVELIEALKEISNGGAPLSKEITKRIVHNCHLSGNSPLTNRERQIMNLMAMGKTYSEISTELAISKETSKTHMRNIYAKMKVKKKSEAISLANRERWI